MDIVEWDSQVSAWEILQYYIVLCILMLASAECVEEHGVFGLVSTADGDCFHCQ